MTEKKLSKESIKDIEVLQNQNNLSLFTEICKTVKKKRHGMWNN